MSAAVAVAPPCPDCEGACYSPNPMAGDHGECETCGGSGDAPALDMDARYAVAGYDGIAFYLRGYVETPDADTEWTGELVTDYSQVRAVMVGDDREHVIDVSDLTPLDDADYCGQCGQIGCEHDGRSIE